MPHFPFILHLKVLLGVLNKQRGINIDESFFLCLTRLTTFCPLLHENKFSLPTTEHSFVEKGEEQRFFPV